MDSVLVIGGGPAGLIAGAILADAGARTTVLEAKARLGGRAASHAKDGFALNQGPHALFAGGAGARELARLGVQLPLWNPQSLSRSVWLRDGQVRRTFGGPRALAGVAGLMRRVAAEPQGLGSVTAAEWLATTVPPPARRAAAAFVTLTTYVADHDHLSADVAAQQLLMASRAGVRYLHGGWQSLVDALAGRARRSGAVVRTSSPARTLERRGDAWCVATDEAEHAAGAVVVATGHPAATRALLGERVTPPGPESAVSCLDLGLRRLPRRSSTFALGIDAPLYLSRHSPPAHPAGVLLTVAGYAGQPREDLERTADAVQPGWRDEVVLQRHLPRMVPVAALATARTGGLSGRPGIEVADAPGVFVAGDWIGPEGWLADAALASGAAAARAALERSLRRDSRAVTAAGDPG